MKSIAAMLAGLALLWPADRACAQGIIIWNESVNGPLSNNPNNFTSLGILGIGTNTIIAASERNGATGAYDFFTFSIPNGTQVGSIISGTDLLIEAWIGTPDGLTTLGYAYPAGNGDLLPQFGLTNVSAGTYAFYVGNLNLVSGFSVANYQLNFVVQPVPEPGTLCLFALGAGALLLARTRKSS